MTRLIVTGISAVRLVYGSVQSLWLFELKQAHMALVSIKFRLNARINRYLLVKIKTLRERLSSKSKSR